MLLSISTDNLNNTLLPQQGLHRAQTNVQTHSNSTLRASANEGYQQTHLTQPLIYYCFGKMRPTDSVVS